MLLKYALLILAIVAISSLQQVTCQTEGRDIETVTEREKEPLSPDYKDPRKTTPPQEDGSSGQPDFSIIDIPAGIRPPQHPSHPSTGPGFDISGFGSFPSFGSDFGPSFPSFGSFPNSLLNVFGLQNQKQWWKGPNVCTEREEMVESPDGKDDSEDGDDEDGFNIFSNINFSTCQQTPNKYQCTTKTSRNGAVKTVVVKYRCCHGYRREGNVCKELELKPLLDTCQDLAGSEFTKMIRTAELESRLSSENFTIFIPSDVAINLFSEKMLEMNQVELLVEPARKRRDMNMKNAISVKDLVRSHIVPGFSEIDDLSNDEVLHSDYKNSTIRINVYPMADGEGLMTANCIRISKRDNMATNGVVHVLDGVIPPVTQSINQIISESSKFTNLKRILEKTGLMQFLKENEVFTILAPNDEAFDKLAPELKQKLLKGDGCAKNIIRHHIIPGAVCSNAVTINATTRNLEDEAIRFYRDDNKININGVSNIVELDIIGTNGIIHAIDSIMIPDSGLTPMELMEKRNMTEFVKLIKDAGLTNVFTQLDNVTYIVPSDEAIKAASEELDKFKNDKEKLTEILMYHTIKGELKSCDFNDDVKVPTGLAEQSLQFNLYQTLPFLRNIYNRVTVNCAKLISHDQQACGSVIHEINKVLIPSSKSLVEEIGNNENYSVFKDILSGTDLERELSQSNTSYTILVPTNEAFKKLPENTLQKFLEDKAMADRMLRMHVIPDSVCCSGIGYQSFPFTERIPTLSSYTLIPSHDKLNRVKFADASVTSCDNMASNGIIHEVNKVIQPPKRNPNPFADLSLIMFNL